MFLRCRVNQIFTISESSGHFILNFNQSCKGKGNVGQEVQTSHEICTGHESHVSHASYSGHV